MKVKYSRLYRRRLRPFAEDLLKALSDFFLESGFQNPYMQFSEWNQHSLEDLKRAIQQALESGESFDADQAERIRQALESMSAEDLDQLLDRLAQSWWTRVTSASTRIRSSRPVRAARATPKPRK